MRSRAALAVAFVSLVLSLHCRHETPHPTDDLGRAVRVPPRIERVITLAPNVTEIVAAIGAQAKIVATDDFSNYPRAVGDLPKVGGLEPSLERIAQLEPDMVIASTSGNPASLAPALENLDIPLFVVRTDRLSDVGRVMVRLGEILDATGGASAERDLATRLARQKRRRMDSPRVLFLVWTDPLYVAGNATFMSDLFEAAGATNAVGAGVNGWPQYSMEALLAHPPAVILYPQHAVGRERLEKLFAADPRWRELDVVRSKRYFGVDDDRFSRPGPRVAEALVDLNRILDSVSF